MARDRNTTTAPEGERIAKVMARAGLASRREAEAWIAAGRVTVNGAVISSAALNVTGRDRVIVDGKPLPTRERTRLFLFHKPRGVVTTSADPQGRPTIYAALPKNLPRLISVGRLDLNTEGLLLLTNDGGLARALELPATGWLRRYRVRAHGTVTQLQLDALRDGIDVDGIRYGSIEATLDRAQGANVWLTFAIREGKNREVRNVLGALGLTVARLIRVSFGPFQLGELPAGQVEEVKTRVLREQLGEKLVRLAGCDFSTPAADSIPPREGRVAPKAPGGAKPEGRRENPTRLLAPLGATLPLRGREKMHRRKPREVEPEPEKPKRQVFQGGKPWEPPAKPGGRGRPDAKGLAKPDNRPHGRGRPYHGKRDR